MSNEQQSWNPPGPQAAAPQQYPYAAPPQHPYAASPPATGVVAWALGFIVFVPIPFLSAFAAGIAMAVAYGPLSKRGPLARENARVALNWGLTFTLTSTLAVITHFVLLFTVAGGEGTTDFYPLGIAITIWGVLILVQIVLTIVGTIRASRGKVMKVPFAIPFVRR